MSVEPEVFADHARWLARRGGVIPLSGAVERLTPSGGLRGRAAALTFDDGFSSVYDHAFPVLRRHGLPATVFLVARTLAGHSVDVDWVDRPPREPLTTLRIEQIREMRAAGVSFESHSWGHVDLTRLSYEDCVKDLRESRELLESVLEAPVRMLAYPRGRHNAEVRAAAARAGYTHAFTLPERREESGPYAVPRVGVYHDNSVARLRLKASGPYLRLRTTGAAGLRSRLRPTPSAP
jgi:peptidoglycan/xylan/chitin deacetylase (PgdA/CDA1 family)